MNNPEKSLSPKKKRSDAITGSETEAGVKKVDSISALNYDRVKAIALVVMVIQLILIIVDFFVLDFGETPELWLHVAHWFTFLICLGFVILTYRLNRNDWKELHTFIFVFCLAVMVAFVSGYVDQALGRGIMVFVYGMIGLSAAFYLNVKNAVMVCVTALLIFAGCTLYIQDDANLLAGYLINGSVIPVLTGILFITGYKRKVKEIEQTRRLIEYGQAMESSHKSIILISEGQLDIDIEVNSPEDKLGKSCILLRDTLKSIIADMNYLSEKAVEGKLSVRGDAEKYSGDFAKILDGVNHTMDAVINPINETYAVLNEIANFNLNPKIKGEYRGDFEKIKNALQLVTGNMNDIVKEISVTIKELKNSSAHLTEASGLLAAGSEEANAMVASSTTLAEKLAERTANTAEYVKNANRNVLNVAGAVENINNTVGKLAAVSAQSSTIVGNTVELVKDITAGISETAKTSNIVNADVTKVVSSVQSISNSLQKVSLHCDQSISITADAKEKAETTNLIINRLNNASREIGKIVSIISDIADQTNMLALNAAIEAAGAGKAGRGFTVVANEVKELAGQTVEATEEISQQIDAMRSQMEEAVAAVAVITGVVDQVNNITSTITAAITEQSMATADISVSAGETAKRVEHIAVEINDVSVKADNVALNADESAGAVNEITRSVAELNKSSNKVAVSAEQMARLLEEILQMVDKNTVDIETIPANMEEMDVASLEVANNARYVNDLGAKLGDVADKLEVLNNKFVID